MFVRHTHVYDGQHHEDEGLQGNNKNVENRPRHGQQPLRVKRQQCNQDEDQLTGVHIAK